MPIGKTQHEDVLTKYIEELEEEGYRVIRLEGKSPDGIAVKCLACERRNYPEIKHELELDAIEALGKTYRKGRGWHTSWTHNAKRKIYSMFDKVLIKTFKRDKNYIKGGPPY